jgi:putative transposase
VGSRDFWLEVWEKEAIIDFRLKNPLEGYRRLTFMMLDADVVAVSPTSVWRVLKQAGLLSRWKAKPSRKGTGFEQPLQPHQHWHIAWSWSLNLGGCISQTPVRMRRVVGIALVAVVLLPPAYIL